MMNAIASFFPEEWVRTFAWTLIHSIWQGAVIALLVAGVIIFLRRHRPEIRYTLLCLLLALFPLMFTGTFLYYFNLEQQADQKREVTLRADTILTDESQIMFDPGLRDINSENWISFTSRIIENQADIMVIIWLAGFLFFLFRFTGSLWYTYRLKKTSLYDPGLEWEHSLMALAGRLGLNKKIKLAESALAKVPLTLGYLRPVILLPLGTLSGVPLIQLEAILLHEVAHIQRRDYLINIMQSVVEILFFYHPASWWLSGLIREEREHICDDMVVRINKDHINYIKALTTMEELNSKSPLLAHAITGSRKKLLSRVKRLINPGKFRKGFGEVIIVVLIVIGMASAFSMNALSVIPNSYDLTGRESGGKVYNLLPISELSQIQDPKNTEYNSGPDTIIATSGSGKVRVMVFTDSTEADDQKNLQVFVESIDDHAGNWSRAPKEVNKEVIILKGDANQSDSLRKTIIIKTGDSVEVIMSDTVMFFSDNDDTTITLCGAVGYYNFDSFELPEILDLEDLQEMSYFYIDENQSRAARDMERAIREQEFSAQDMERMQREMERQQKQFHFESQDHPGLNPDNEKFGKEWSWTQMNPEPRMNESERIIRQELWDDGLIESGRKYIIELDSKAMYINGEKQSRESYKKYRRLAESLESVTLDSATYKIIF